MALDIICDVNDPHQNGRIASFDSSGAPDDQEFVRGDINLAISIRPVKASAGERLWEDDFIAGDTFQVAIANPDEPPTGGTFNLAALGGTVATSSIANPSVIVHAASVVTLATGNTVYISGHTGSVPDINGAHVITVTDATHFTIPVNVTTGGTGGSFYLASTGLASIAYNVTTTALATALTVAPLTAPAVTLLTTGVYEARWGSGIAAPTFISPVNSLAPASSVTVIDDTENDVQVRIIDLKQEPVAYAEPATAFTVAGVTAAVKQAGGATANKVYAISLNAAGTYGGTYALNYTGVGIASVTVGVFTPTSTPQDIQTAFELVSASGDFTVNTDANGVVTIEMRGTQGLSNTPVIAASNINLLAPLGVSGVIALNTTNLYRAFWNTTSATLDFTLEVRRTRATGEVSAIFEHAVTLKRNIIDGVIVPTVLAAYYTQAQTDTLIASAIGGLDISDISGLGTMAAQDANAVAISGGSADSISLTNIVGDMTLGGSFNGLFLNDGGGGSVISITDASAVTSILLAAGSALELGSGSGIVLGSSAGLTVNAAGVVFSNGVTFVGTNGSTLNFGAGGTMATGANPTGIIGLTAVNGTATTCVRSDGAQALSQAIIPTWTGAHTWSAAVTFNSGFTCSPASGTVTVHPTAAGSIDNMAFGQSTPLAVSATTLSATGLASLLGGLKLTYAQKTATYTFAATDFCIEATANSFTLNLPTAVGRIGQPFLAVNSGAGTITLSTTGGQTINGLSTISILQNTAITVTSNGANYIITGEYGAASTGSFSTLTASGAVTFTSGTASSSTTTGAIVVTGGIGLSGQLTAGGDIVAATAGNGLKIKGGTGGRLETVPLTGGTATVSMTSITANSIVFLQRVTAGGTLGAGGYDYTISAGVSITINSVDLAGVLSVLDTSTVAFFVVEKG